MKKYIEAEELLKRLNARKYSVEKTTRRQVAYNAAINAACRCVDAMPAADVVEVRHGEWIVFGEQIENQTFDECKCSECGCVEYFNKGWKHFNYCPNCGALMDGGGDTE